MRHQTRPIHFLLVVDDFGIQYDNQAGITHILDSLKTIYKISKDWGVKLYYGISLEWNYSKCQVLVSMMEYVTKALHKFQHSTPWQVQYAPYQWKRPKYGDTKQLETTLDTSPPISE